VGWVQKPAASKRVTDRGIRIEIRRLETEENRSGSSSLDSDPPVVENNATILELPAPHPA
jgi:hypothetical protein